MTNRNSRQRKTSPRLSWRVAGMSLLGCAAVSLSLAGCGSAEEETVAAPREYVPPPVVDTRPAVTPISELMAELRIDERVDLPESEAPDNDEARRALLEFFDGFARGDHSAVARMLTTQDRRELDALVASGQWYDTTEGIGHIGLQTGLAQGSGGISSEFDVDITSLDNQEIERMILSDEFKEIASAMGISDGELAMIRESAGTPEMNQAIDMLRSQVADLKGSAEMVSSGDHCVLALFEVDGELQAQLWNYGPAGDGFRFESVWTPPDMVRKLSGTNWIAAWYDIIAYEMMLANRPDERVAPPQRRLDEE